MTELSDFHCLFPIYLTFCGCKKVAYHNPTSKRLCWLILRHLFPISINTLVLEFDVVFLWHSIDGRQSCIVYHVFDVYKFWIQSIHANNTQTWFVHHQTKPIIYNKYSDIPHSFFSLCHDRFLLRMSIFCSQSHVVIISTVFHTTQKFQNQIVFEAR